MKATSLCAPFTTCRQDTNVGATFSVLQNQGDWWGEGDEMIFMYRFHLDSPIPFERYFKMTIEHGHANHRSDNLYSVAYWYQMGPHRKRKPLPPVAERIPRMINTEGPTVGK